MLSTLFSFIEHHWKGLIIACISCIILALVGLLIYLQKTIDTLDAENQLLTYKLTLAKQEIEGLNTNLSAVRIELESSNSLLNECYTNIEKRTHDLTEIEQIMSIKTKYLADTETIKEEEELRSYDVINTQINRAGLDFINRQYNTLQ